MNTNYLGHNFVPTAFINLPSFYVCSACGLCARDYVENASEVWYFTKLSYNQLNNQINDNSFKQSIHLDLLKISCDDQIVKSILE